MRRKVFKRDNQKKSPHSKWATTWSPGLGPEKGEIRTPNGSIMWQDWIREDETTEESTSLNSPLEPHFKNKKGDFPGGAVVKNLPANAGDTGSSPARGKSHMPGSN